MDFRRHLKLCVPKFNFFPFLNVLFILLGFIAFILFISKSSFLKIALPKGVTSDIASPSSLTIIVTGENVVYVNNHLITLGELKEFLAFPGGNARAILIKADHRASVGRVVDILNLARSMGIEHINIATDREK